MTADPTDLPGGTQSLKIVLPDLRRPLGPDRPAIADSASDSLVISRNGDVRMRAKKRTISTFFGRVHRDKANPKRWVAENDHGLPVGTKTSTRAEAVEQLVTYIDSVVLETVPAEEHHAVTTGPVALPVLRRPRVLLSVVEWGVGALGLGVLGLLIYGITTLY